LAVKAARIHSFGPPDVVVVEDVPMPSPGPNEVLVRVMAAGVAPWDAIIREGKSKVSPQPPLTLGSDLSGVVEKVGPGVTGCAPAAEAIFFYAEVTTARLQTLTTLFDAGRITARVGLNPAAFGGAPGGNACSRAHHTSPARSYCRSGARSSSDLRGLVLIAAKLDRRTNRFIHSNRNL
jgi:NADPH:quinone reductase-like Zn-dependent oxidoreductase